MQARGLGCARLSSSAPPAESETVWQAGQARAAGAGASVPEGAAAAQHQQVSCCAQAHVLPRPPVAAAGRQGLPAWRLTSQAATAAHPAPSRCTDVALHEPGCRRAPSMPPSGAGRPAHEQQASAVPAQAGAAARAADGPGPGHAARPSLGQPQAPQGPGGPFAGVPAPGRCATCLSPRSSEVQRQACPSQQRCSSCLLCATRARLPAPVAGTNRLACSHLGTLNVGARRLA